MKLTYVVCDTTQWLVNALSSAGLTVQHVVPEDHNTERQETRALAEVANAEALIVYTSNTLICGRYGPPERSAEMAGFRGAPRPDLWGDEGHKLVLQAVPPAKRGAIFVLDNHGGAEVYVQEGLRVFSTEQELIDALRAAAYLHQNG